MTAPGTNVDVIPTSAARVTAVGSGGMEDASVPHLRTRSVRKVHGAMIKAGGLQLPCEAP